MSAKNRDEHGRFRNIIVGFRVSPEENEQINIAVALSGLPKQEYCYRRCLNRDIVVQGNPRVYKALRNQLAAVLEAVRGLAGEADGDGAGVLQLAEQVAPAPAAFVAAPAALTTGAGAAAGGQAAQRCGREDQTALSDEASAVLHGDAPLLCVSRSAVTDDTTSCPTIRRSAFRITDNANPRSALIPDA